MKVELHPHAQARILERGATEQEVVATIEEGERFPVKHDRTGFRRNFAQMGRWGGKRYSNKQIEVIAIPDNEGWIVITVIVKYF